MKNLHGKIAGFFIAAFLLLIAVPLSVSADDVTVQCGDNVYGTLNDIGVLTISGTGDMWDVTSGWNSHFHSMADDIYQVVIQDGVTSIGDCAFGMSSGKGCFDKIISVTIGSSVKNIGKYAFSGTTGLFSIDIPGNVETIGEGAFYGSVLSSVTFHEGLKTIDNYAFYNTELKSVTLPEGISAVKESAFRDSDLSSVSIPNQIALIESGAFPKVSASIYSRDVIIVAGAFESGSTIHAYHGSTADTYASNYNFDITYFPEYYTVTLDPKGGSVSKTSLTVQSDTYYGSLPKPKREGYLFLGWYTSDGEEIGIDTEVRLSDITLYAHWRTVKVGKSQKLTVTSRKTRQATVKFKKVKNADGYQIAYSTKKSLKSAKYTSTTSLTKIIKSLKKGKKYYFRVRAYRLDSTGKRVYGDWSAWARATIK